MGVETSEGKIEIRVPASMQQRNMQSSVNRNLLLAKKKIFSRGDHGSLWRGQIQLDRGTKLSQVLFRLLAYCRLK